VQQSFIEKWQDPKDSGNLKIGSKITVMDGPIFVAEDSVVFEQPLVYSIKTQGKCLMWRCKAQRVLNNFPQETIEEMKLSSGIKYKWFFQ